MKKKYILIIGALAGLVFFGGVASAHHNNYQPTPTLTSAPTPTCTPTPSVTDTPTPEPTTPPSSVGDGQHSGPDGLGCAAHDCNTFPNSPQDGSPVGWK